MENHLRHVFQERVDRPDTLGVMLVEGGAKAISSPHDYAAVLLFMVNAASQPVFIEHYSIGDKKILLLTVTREKILDWIVNEKNRTIMNWLDNGKVLFERDEFVNQLKQEAKKIPLRLKKEKLAWEFSKAFVKFRKGKTFFDKEYYYDAYKCAVETLNHLGRMAVIEKGLFPGTTVWQQVRKFAPEISKLYEELILSNESLDKRLQLFFIAGGFYIHSKTESGVQYFTEVLGEKDQWTINEMYAHEKLESYFPEFYIVLEYLIEKSFVKIISEEAKDNNIWHRYYMVNKA